MTENNDREFMPVQTSDFEAQKRRKEQLGALVQVLREPVSALSIGPQAMEAIRLYCEGQQIDFTSLQCSKLLQLSESTLKKAMGESFKELKSLVVEWDKTYFSGRQFLKFGMSQEVLDEFFELN